MKKGRLLLLIRIFRTSQQNETNSFCTSRPSTLATVKVEKKFPLYSRITTLVKPWTARVDFEWNEDLIKLEERKIFKVWFQTRSMLGWFFWARLVVWGRIRFIAKFDRKISSEMRTRLVLSQAEGQLMRVDSIKSKSVRSFVPVLLKLGFKTKQTTPPPKKNKKQTLDLSFLKSWKKSFCCAM